MKCDRYAPLEANNAQAWPKIIAPRSGKSAKSAQYNVTRSV
jgi:hypothetical protein